MNGRHLAGKLADERHTEAVRTDDPGILDSSDVKLTADIV